MYLATLLSLFLAADPVPVAGRPKDFSGAIGGPFVVTTSAEPTTVKTGEPITFTIRITGPGDLSTMRRPDLEHDEMYARFTVENGPERDLNPGREFQYLLRPRTPNVWTIFHIKFVYFNPTIALTDRGFQTTYSSDIRITVKPEQPSELPDTVWAWIERTRKEEPSSFRRWVDSITAEGRRGQTMVFWLFPPLTGLVLYRMLRSATPKDLRAAPRIETTEGRNV